MNDAPLKSSHRMTAYKGEAVLACQREAHLAYHALCSAKVHHKALRGYMLSVLLEIARRRLWRSSQQQQIAPRYILFRQLPIGHALEPGKAHYAAVYVVSIHGVAAGLVRLSRRAADKPQTNNPDNHNTINALCCVSHGHAERPRRTVRG